MSKMCLYPTPKIQELANKIKQEYPEASQRNNFSDQMCAEWIGLYNDANSKNPDDVPTMKSLVNFIEKLRNKEGMSFLRDLKAEERQRAIEQEMQDIKARAIANGTFMRAPNGKPTNLNERQWLQVRTKAFKDWFGNWENNPSEASKVVDENGEPKIMYHGTPWGNFNVFNPLSPNTGDRTRPGEIFFSSVKWWADSYTTGTFNEGTKTPKTYAVFLNIRNPYKNSEPTTRAEANAVLFEQFGTILTEEEYNAIYEKLDEKNALSEQLGLSPHLYNVHEIISEYFKQKGDVARFNEVMKKAIASGFNDGMIYLTREEWEGEPIVFKDGVKRQVWVTSPNQIKSAVDNNGEFSIDSNSILASPQAYEEIPAELMGEIADEVASREAYDSLESSDPDLNKKFGGKTEATVSEILNNLLQNDSPFNDFIKTLLDNIGEIGNIKVKLVPNSQSKGYAGFYDTIENTIYINRNATFKGKDGKVDNSILHEIIHAIVANSLNTAKHREELNSIFEEAREKILKKYNVNTFEELPENLRRGRLYGLSNLDEFAAEFFTNSEFISELNDENTFGKRSDKKSIISKLLEWIKSLLPKGVTETYKRSGEILEDILLNSGGNIQTNRNLLSGDNSAANTQNLPGPETKINIYAGTGENADLSNFAYRPFKIENSDTVAWIGEGPVEFKSVEQFFQASKVMFGSETPENEKLLREIMNTTDGSRLRALGKSHIEGFDSKKWDSENNSNYIMKKGLTESFKQNPQALQRLLATGTATLTHTQDKGKWGTEFPRLLMEVRDELRKASQQQPTSTIDHRFKQGIETLAGYYEGGGRLITDDFPGVPKKLDDKLNNHFMGGEELSDDDYRELAKYISVVKNTDANTSQGWPYIAVPKQHAQASSQASEAASLAASATTFGTAPTAEQQAEAQRKYEEKNTPKPKAERPRSNAFESALKVTENRITQFYQTFTPQQIKDRGTMIADYFSDIIDDYILDELDRLNDIIEDDDATAEEKEEARKIRNLLRDPINGRQYAANKIQIGNILDQIKDKIRRKVNSYDGVKKQLWQNTLDFFKELFNNQASLEIEEQEGIRIIGLQMVEKSPDDVVNEEENDGNDETGHIVSGNDGWLFQARFEDPAASLSKKVRRMLYNIKRSREDADDLGHTRKYSSGQVYATLLSYLAKNMQNPDDFMQVIKPDDYEDIYDHYGNEVTQELYPYGYPTFPVLEKMRSQYPWVEQIINRLTDDYLDAEWNTCIAYPSTYGAMASQFYTNFRKVFIPYAKIQVGEGKFGITPLNTEMEVRCQKDKLAANFNNGIVLTDTGIYNTDTTINREHAEDLKDFIQEIIDGDNVSHAYSLYRDSSSEDTILEQEDIDDFNKFVDQAVFILQSFGISSNRENVIAILAQTENGQAFTDMMKDLYYVADTVSKISDENAANFNYLVDLQYVGGEKVWNKFFEGRGVITDESYMQSFYDSASKKTRYSYSADNYLQKIFRGLYNPDRDERRKFIEEHFMKYEWFYNHKTNTWRNRWLEHLYNAQDITNELPYRNINNITEYDENTKVRDYSKWTPDDVWLVQNRSYKDDAAYAYYLAPIFSDSPMSMTVKGPVMSSSEVLDALVDLVDQELWRIKYVNERAQAIERGEVKEIANFDGKRGRQFCFIPELNTFTFENGETLLDVLNRMKEGKDENGNHRNYTAQEIDDIKRNAIMQVMTQKAQEYLDEFRGEYTDEIDPEAFLRSYMNMEYANASIIQFTTIDLAFYKSDVDFQKRFKEVYAGGIQLNTNSRYGQKTENVIILTDDIITSPSYTDIAKIINDSTKLSAEDKKHILNIFKEVNVADAQAIRAMHSFRSVMDMMGRWDERSEEALEHFKNGTWSREDFDVIYQTIKPFVYTVIDRNDGFGGVIPVPQQHKNSEICALMMYSLITNDLHSPVYEALSEFMDRKDTDGNYLIHMAQFESAGKVGNQGVININFNPNKVIRAIDEGLTINGEEVLFIPNSPNTLSNAEANYRAIKEQLDELLDAQKISQEDYNKTIAYLRPTKDEIISMLEQSALITNEDGSQVINPEVVHTIPFDNYYQAQPTPEHHIDAEATFGSQARNISVADLPDDFQLTLQVKGKTITLKGKDAVVDFYYELLDENLIEDFFGKGNKKGLKDVFASKEAFCEAVTDIVRGNPKYGKDFVDALRTDSDGNFVLSPNSPTMFTLMQELVTSLFKNRITKQRINGAALIQAAGIGLDTNLRLVKDAEGNIVGAQCLMPLTSERFFKPFLEERIINGQKKMVLNPEKLKEAGLDKAIGYRIPTENKSSMLPLIIEGFTPLQNGSCIILPAEITALAGSDFDVDKMFIMLSEFYIQNYDMDKALKAYARIEHQAAQEVINALGKANINDLDIEEVPSQNFREWFNEHKDEYLLDKPIIKRVEYDFSKSPKENGRKARNNMLIQMIYGILTSEAGNESLLNPQGYDNFKAAAKLNRIINDPVLKEQLLKNYAQGVSEVTPSAEQIKQMFLEKYKEIDASRLDEIRKTLSSMSDEQIINAYIEATVAEKDDVVDFLLNSSLKEREDFIKRYSATESPIYPQTFAHSHARNMAGDNQIGIYAIQGSMAAKYQRAKILLRPNQQFKINGRTINDVDASEDGKRLKRVGEMIGASADNGKDPNLSDAGSTSKTAPIIGYMLRLGLTHEEAVLLINQPAMKDCNFDASKMEKQYPGIKKVPVGELNTKTLIKAILNPFSVSATEQQAIDAVCYRILTQAKAMEGLTMISRADSPNGAMQNSFAKARVQQYMVELFNAQMEQNEFPFYRINEVINNKTVDVSKGEDAVREALKAQPMAFLHAMYGLGINSLNDLASPYFFMLSKHFDDAIVKPILYNQNSNFKDSLEDLVNRIYLQYITYVLSSSPLFGDETNADGTVTTMKEKRDYYLNSFADDFAKILQENDAIRDQIGSILQRDGNRVVLRDVGSLAKGQKDAISRRFDALISLGEEGQKLAKDLLLYSFYDSGLNFTHDSFSSRLSTYFLSQFPAFKDILQQLDNPLTEEQEQNFVYQFLLSNKDAAYSVDGIIKRDEHIIDEDIVIDMNDYKMNRKFVNTILSPNPRMTGVQPYPYISFDGDIYVLDSDAYDMNPAQARYHKLDDYPTSSYRPIYNMNKSVAQMADEYNNVQPQQQPQEKNVNENSVDIAHNDSNDNPAVDNSDSYNGPEPPDFGDFSGIDDVAAPSPYNDEDTLQDPMC